MKSFNGKLIQRAGEIVSGLLQRDTYHLKDSKRDEGRNGESIYSTDVSYLYGKSMLDLSMKELVSIPKQAFRYQNLLILKLSGNLIKTLPFELIRLRHLEELNLQNNNLEFLPAQICGLVKLQVLNLSYNYLTVLPHSVSNLKQLKALDIAYNNIKTLPDSLMHLQMLEHLDLDGNVLTRIPESLCKLSNLKILKVRHNCLQCVPKQLTKLKKLKELDLKGNCLSSTCPESLRKSLVRIETLEIDMELPFENNKNGEANLFKVCFPNNRKKETEIGMEIKKQDVMSHTHEKEASCPIESRFHDTFEEDPIYDFRSFAFSNVVNSSKHK
eukprot:gene15612-17186_t